MSLKVAVSIDDREASALSESIEERLGVKTACSNEYLLFIKFAVS